MSDAHEPLAPAAPRRRRTPAAAPDSDVVAEIRAVAAGLSEEIRVLRERLDAVTERLDDMSRRLPVRAPARRTTKT